MIANNKAIPARQIIGLSHVLHSDFTVQYNFCDLIGCNRFPAAYCRLFLGLNLQCVLYISGPEFKLCGNFAQDSTAASFICGCLLKAEPSNLLVNIFGAVLFVVLSLLIFSFIHQREPWSYLFQRNNDTTENY